MNRSAKREKKRKMSLIKLIIYTLLEINDYYQDINKSAFNHPKTLKTISYWYPPLCAVYTHTLFTDAHKEKKHNNN